MTSQKFPHPEFPTAAPVGGEPLVALLVDGERYVMLTPERAMTLAQDLREAAQFADENR